MTIVLSTDTEARLLAEASRRGIPAGQLAEQLIDAGLAGPPTEAGSTPNRASIELLDRWESENATDDSEEIARRQQEFERSSRSSGAN
jgi:hypothetical protein